MIRLLNLGSDDVVIPGMMNLSFNIELSSTTDTKGTLVSNIGRAIVKKLVVKFEGNETSGISGLDVFACYRNLWKTKLEKRNATGQSIIYTEGFTENCMKLRIIASDKSASNTRDKAITNAHGNEFIIPLDFEMINSAMPYYQAGIREQNLLSTITTELSYQLEHLQISSIRSKISPWNTRLLLILPSQNIFRTNIKAWL